MQRLCDNYYYNIDAWDNGSCPILLIAGYSGSGKTTLGKELSHKYNCPVYEMDGMGKFLNGVLDKEFIDEMKKDRRVWYEYMMQCVIDMHREIHGDSKFIIEGMRVPWLDFEKYEKYPMVIMSTDVIKSTFRACKRAFRKDYIEKYNGIHLQVYIKFNWEYWLPVRRLIKFMEERRK